LYSGDRGDFLEMTVQVSTEALDASETKAQD